MERGDHKGIGWFVVTALMVASCGKPTYDTGQFQSYVAEFESQSARFGHPVSTDDLIITYGHLDGERFGLCETGDGMTPTVQIDEAGWNEADPATRESLLFHELGHCIMGQNHRTMTAEVDGASDPIPTSIMNAVIVDGEVYEAHRDYYLRELFSN